MAIIELIENDNEYIVTIPYAQKERAKSIKGFRWDAERRSWIYPKRQEILKSLMQEFGDDPNCKIQITNIVEVETEELRSPRQLESELIIENLKRDIEKIREEARLQLNTSAIAKEEALSLSRQALAAKEIEYQRLVKIKEELDKQIFDLSVSNRSLDNQIKQLRIDLIDRTKREDPLFQLKEKIKQTSGNEANFCELVDTSNSKTDIVISLTNELERKMRSITKDNDKETVLFDLINDAAESDGFTPEMKDMAHQLRMYRNSIIHPKERPVAIEAKTILFLYTAALLWPQFS